MNISAAVQSKLLFGLVVCAILSTFLVAQIALASHDGTFHNPAEMLGYAWSPNIGWISFNCNQTAYGGANDCGTSNFKTRVNPSGTVTGYAWSQHIGWVQFGSLSGCPSGTCPAKVDFNSSKFSGWARALGHSDPEAGGWDGWISLSGTSPAYGIQVNSSAIFTSDSYAWGSDVIGWVNFSRAALDSSNLCTPANMCTADSLGIIATNIWCQDTTTSCADTNSTYSCSGSPASCSYIAPSGNLNISGTLTQKGSTVTLDWSVQAVDSCRVEGTNGDSWTGTENTGVESSSLTLRVTTYTLYCVPLGGGDEVEIDTAQVQLLPTVQES